MKTVTPALAIINEVAKEHRLKARDLLGRNVKRSVSWPRMLAYWRIRTELEYSLLRIAAIFKRDHTTILHGIRRVEAHLAEQEAETLNPEG